MWPFRSIAGPQESRDDVATSDFVPIVAGPQKGRGYVATSDFLRIVVGLPRRQGLYSHSTQFRAPKKGGMM